MTFFHFIETILQASCQAIIVFYLYVPEDIGEKIVKREWIILKNQQDTERLEFIKPGRKTGNFVNQV